MQLERQLFYGSIILQLVTGTAVVWGEAIGLTLFIDHWGVDALPLAIVIEAVTSIFLIIGFERSKGFLADGVRVSLVGLVGIAILLAGQLLIDRGSEIGFGLFYVTQRIMRDLLLYYTWQYTVGFFENQNRYLIPKILLWSRTWIILSGLSLTLLSIIFDIRDMVWLWIAALAASIVVLGIFADEFQAVPHFRIPMPPQRRTKATRKWLNAMRSAIDTRMIRLIIVAGFCMMFVLTILYVEIVTIFWAVLDSDVALLRWLGIVSSVTTLLMLPLQYNLLPRLVGRYSLNYVNQVLPVSMAVVLIGLVLLPVILVALIAEVVRVSLQRSFYDTLHNQIQSLLPNSLRYWMYTLTEGMVKPIGRLIAGGVLALFLWGDIPLDMVFLPGGIALAGLFVAQWRLSNLYQHQFDETLAAGQYRFLRELFEENLTTNQAIVDSLLQRLRNEPDDEREVLLIAEALAESRSADGFQELLMFLPKCSPAIRAEILLLLAEGWHTEETGNAIHTIVAEALDSEEPKMRQAALRAMSLYPHLLEPFRVAQFMLDPDPNVSTTASQLLLQHPSPQLARGASAMLNWLSHSGDATTRALAVTALVQGGVDRFGMRVIPPDIKRFQADMSARVRLAIVPAADQQDLMHSVIDVSPAVRSAAIKRLLMTRRQSTYTLQDTLATYRDCHTSQDVQIHRIIDYWHLMGALAIASPRFAAQVQKRELRIGIRQLDYIASMRAQLQSLGYPSLLPIITELEHNWRQILDGMLDFLGAAHRTKTVQSLTRTLQAPLSDAEKQLAVAHLAHLLNAELADQLATILAEDRKTYPIISHDTDWQATHAKLAIDTLLQQKDAWLPLLSLLALSFLPAEVYSELVDDALEHTIIKASQHNPDDDIREGARVLRYVLTASANPKGRLAPIHQPDLPEGIHMLSTIERMLFLRNVSFFEHLRLDQLRTLARICEEININQGEYIIRKGEAGDSLFIIVEGEVSIVDPSVKENNGLLVVRKPGDVLGEISLFDGGVRSADAIARMPALLLTVYRDALNDALADDPGIALDMLRTMAQIVRNSNRSLVAMSEQLNVRELTENIK